MNDTSMSASSTNCPSCGTAFICRPGDIGSCHCNSVLLSKEEYAYINSKFSECVCNNCLGLLKQQFTNSTTRP